MKVEFLSHFSKDLERLNIANVKKATLRTIEIIESAKSLSEVPNIKKLSGHKSAYRIKLGNYRIGIFLENNVVELARIVHRKDIYKVFP